MRLAPLIYRFGSLRLHRTRDEHWPLFNGLRDEQIANASVYWLNPNISDPRLAKRAGHEFLQLENRLEILGEVLRMAFEAYIRAPSLLPCCSAPVNHLAYPTLFQPSESQSIMLLGGQTVTSKAELLRREPMVSYRVDDDGVLDITAIK